MRKLKPKEQHELILANADKEQIIVHLDERQEEEVTRLAVALARQCDLFVHFKRLWQMRVADLDARLSDERYMKNIFVNRRTLHRDLLKSEGT